MAIPAGGKQSGKEPLPALDPPMTDQEAFTLLMDILEELALNKNRISTLAKINILRKEVLGRA